MTGGNKDSGGIRMITIEMEYAEKVQFDTILYFLRPIVDTYRTEKRGDKLYAYIDVIA